MAGSASLSWCAGRRASPSSDSDAVQFVVSMQILPPLKICIEPDMMSSDCFTTSYPAS